MLNICKNCGHLIEKVEGETDIINRLFNSEWVHSNKNHPKHRGKSWAVVCRAKGNKCGCLKPEFINKRDDGSSFHLKKGVPVL